VGDDVNVRFYYNLCEDKALKEALYGIACVQDASIATLLEYSDYSFQWNVSFVRAVHD